MADNNKSGGWFPNFNHLLLVCLAGIFLVGQNPFHKSRPNKPETNTTNTVYSVNARVWEDPFEAIEKFKPDTDQSSKKQALANIQQETQEIKDKIDVIAVMLPSEFYYEDRETRRRLRYAVLSGFNTTLRYMPELHNQINPFPDGNYTHTYEWMVYKPIEAGIDRKSDIQPEVQRPPVLLLWLNKDAFADTPHKKLQDLTKKIEQSLKINNISSVSVLGPFDSDGLQDLFVEIREKELESNSSDPEIRYYSPNALIRKENLIGWDKPNSYDLYDFFKDKNLSYLRINASDMYLAQTIKHELKLRGIEASQQNRILLVGEWDKLYTWHLTNTFADELLKNRENDDCKDAQGNPQGYDQQYDIEKQCIFRVSYLRGLDGEKSKAKEEDNPKESKNKTADTKETVESMERADGDSQFDYIRRMANQMEALDKEIRNKNYPHHDAHAIKAIGILGSDVYDKLLISEALHNKFPDAVFFTTGMDARLLEPKNNLWMHNMIIASNFGLQLNRSLQKDIPPFRDSEQTAYFLATEMALTKQFADKEMSKALAFKDNAKSLLLKTTQSELYDSLMSYDSVTNRKDITRIFEIGRTRAFDLSTDCGESCLHPTIDKPNWDIRFLAI